jgi:hypothetical protein
VKLNKFILLVVWLLSIIISGCQEPYDGENLQNIKKIPVFQGAITDDPGPYTVTVYWASAYNSSLPVPVGDAKVYILDDFKILETLSEVSGGIYRTAANGIRGKVGTKYHIRVKMGDGSIYESAPTMLYPKTNIDTIYSEKGSIDAVSKDEDGNIITRHIDGLNVYSNVIASKNNSAYYKFDFLYITQTTHSPKPKPTDPAPSGPPPIIYCRSVSVSSGISQVKSVIAEGNNLIIKKNSLVFLPYNVDLSGTDSSTPVLNVGWIVSATLSSISSEAYKYYFSISEQLNAGARMFDPIPSQIKGNMRCITDSTRIALGLFEVTSQTTKNIAFRWAPSVKEINVVNVNDIGPLTDECDTNFTPSYWENFSR